MSKVRIVNFSGGKDSTAMLLRMIELGVPIDEIRYFDCGSWEFPQMKRHISKVEKYINRPIKRLRYKYTFDYLFAEIKKKDGRIGYGFPIMTFRWCTGRKMDTLRKGLSRKDTILYIGYATDETKRADRYLARKNRLEARFPLIEWGWSEKDCLEYCYSKGFDWEGLYKYFKRVSCWCCPFQSLNNLRNLRKHFPALWKRLLAMQEKQLSNFKAGYAPRGGVAFRMDGTTVFDLDKKFREEELNTEDFMKKVSLLPLNKIKPNPNQPRQYFDLEELRRLADSIKREGLHSPILVLKEGDTYKIVHGERRFRAHQMIGATHIRAIVVQGWDDKKVFLSAFLENDARDDLLPIEVARALKKMMSDYKMSAEEVAQATQRSVSTVLNTISLLEESPQVQRALNEGKLNLFQVLTLRRVKDRKTREKLLQGLLDGSLPHKAFLRKVQEHVRVEKMMKMLPEVAPFEVKTTQARKSRTLVVAGIPSDFKLYYVLGERMDYLVDMLPERNVLVSAYTMLRKKNARPLMEKLVRDRDKINSLIVDSGLLSAIANGDKDWVNHQRNLIKLAEILDADFVTHMDCPLYKRVVDNWGVSQEEMYRKTIENAKEFRRMRTKAVKIYSLQGFRGAEDYLQCLKEYEKIGIFDEECVIGIGGAMARSNKLCYRVAELVREELDKVAPHTRIHFFGIANPKRIVELYKRGVSSVDNVGPLAATINNLLYDEDGKTKRALFKSRLPREMFDASLIWNWHAYYYLLKQEFAKLKKS